MRCQPHSALRYLFYPLANIPQSLIKTQPYWMLLKNLVYQLFTSGHASLGGGQPDNDPEKGGQVENANGAGDAQDSSDVGSPTEGSDPIEDYGEEDEHLAIDDEHDVDDIIHDLEIDEHYAGRDNDGDETSFRPRLRRRLSSFSRFSTISSTPSAPPAWYLKAKAILNPKTTHHDIESCIPHYRHTPIISGIVIPFAILLEIPGLTEHWYIRTSQNNTVETKKNPAILNVALGLSITCALVANISLVFRFLEKKVKVSTVICVVFLTFHDLINIAAVTIFGVQHRFDDGFTYGQSFWMTVCSTVASSFTNFTLIMDLVRTPDFANSGSGLTRKQRSLVIIVIILICYIAFGALIFSLLLKLSFINALYFTVVSIETIGFGDITPKTPAGRVVTCIYAAFGIVNLALAVGLLRETVLEALEVGYRKRVKAVRERRRLVRFKRRVRGRWREAIEWRLRASDQPTWAKDDPDAHKHAWFLKWVDKLWPTGNGKYFHYGAGFGLGYGRHPHGMHLNLEALTGAQLEAAALEAGVPLNTLLPPGFKVRCASEGVRRNSRLSGMFVRGRGATEEPKKNGFGVNFADSNANPVPGGSNPNPNQSLQLQLVPSNTNSLPLTHARLGRMITMLGSFALAMDRSGRFTGDNPMKAPSAGGKDAGGDADARTPGFKKSLSQEYDEHRGEMESEETKAFYARLTVAWTLFLVFWTIGSAIFMQTEGWSYGTAMYFCFVAFMTIGYGDYSPSTPAGRSIFVVWALLGVATMTILISVISEAYSYRYKHALHSVVFSRALKRYRKRALDNPNKARTRKESSSSLPPSSIPIANPGSTSSPVTPTRDRNEDSKRTAHAALSDAQARATGHLEALPHKILRHAQVFHDHVRYFFSRSPHATGSVNDGSVPEELKKLMDDIIGAEKLSGRMKEEILQDDDARHAVFTLSIEKALRRLIDVTEDALDALEERNKYAALHERLKSSESLQSDDSIGETPYRSRPELERIDSIRTTGVDSVYWEDARFQRVR